MEEEQPNKTRQNSTEVTSDHTDKTKSSCSLIADLEVKQSSADLQGSTCSSIDLVDIIRQKYKKKGILVSYDIRGTFTLKRLVSKTVKELKDLGFQDDIWFDKDEGKPRSSWSFAQRLQVAEECNAAIVFLSDSYFLTAPSKYEANVFKQRAQNKEINPNGNPFRVFVVKCAVVSSEEFEMYPTHVDLTSTKISQASVAEKASTIVGILSVPLESCVTFTTKLYHELSQVKGIPEHVRYDRKSVNDWDTCDVQDWLYSLRVLERYRMSFEEAEVDGYLLESLTEEDMIEFLNVDSKLSRQKIILNLKRILDKEKLESWDERCQSRKIRDSNVYLICDPNDVWIAEFIKSDLMKTGIMVHWHQSFGSSEEISLQSKSNARYLAEAAMVIFVMTSSTEKSNFIFRELSFVAWLGKPIITAVFRNSWKTSRHSLKAIIGKKSAISFERNRCLDGLEILRYHVTPSRCQPRAKLHQQYTHKVLNGIKPLESLVSEIEGLEVNPEVERPKVFLSNHWDMQNKVGRIKEFLDRHGCESWIDAGRAMAVSLARPWEYHICGTHTQTGNAGVFIQEQMSCSTVVVMCITQKYLHSDNFIKDTQLAQLHKKPVIPVLLQWCARPLDRVTTVAKKLEISCGVIDMYNEQLFRRNLPELVNLIMRVRPRYSLKHKNVP